MKKEGSTATNNRFRVRRSRTWKAIEREVVRNRRFQFKVSSFRSNPCLRNAEKSDRIVSSKRRERGIVSRISKRTNIVGADVERARIQFNIAREKN